MHQEIDRYCARIGSDPMLVQGPGGNVSWKAGDTLHIKASGTWLADAQRKSIFVSVDLDDLRSALARGNFEVTAQNVGDSQLRASIETLLHALMPHKIVVHTHAIEPLAVLVRRDFEAELAQKLRGRLNYAVTGYRKPGAELAQAVHAALQDRPGTNVVFLQNHGLVVGGETTAEIDHLMKSVVNALANPEREVSRVVAPLPLQGYAPPPVDRIHELACDAFLLEQVEKSWALYPDHVVFLGPAPRMFHSTKAFVTFLGQSQTRPELVFVKDYGVLTSKPLSAAKLAYLKCFYDVLVRQAPGMALATLATADIALLIDWDAEKYRQQL